MLPSNINPNQMQNFRNEPHYSKYVSTPGTTPKYSEGSSISKEVTSLTQSLIRDFIKNKEISNGTGKTVRPNKQIKTLKNVDDLLTSIYQTGKVTDKQHNEIMKLATDLKVQKESKQGIVKSKVPEAGIALAELGVRELEELSKVLKLVEPIENKLQKNFDRLSDGVFNPARLHSDSLRVTPELIAAGKQLMELRKYSNIGSEGTQLRSIVNEKFEDAKVGFIAIFEEWQDAALTLIRESSNAIIKKYESMSKENENIEQEMRKILGIPKPRGLPVANIEVAHLEPVFHQNNYKLDQLHELLNALDSKISDIIEIEFSAIKQIIGEADNLNSITDNIAEATKMLANAKLLLESERKKHDMKEFYRLFRIPGNAEDEIYKGEFDGNTYGGPYWQSLMSKYDMSK